VTGTFVQSTFRFSDFSSSVYLSVLLSDFSSSVYLSFILSDFSSFCPCLSVRYTIPLFVLCLSVRHTFRPFDLSFFRLSVISAFRPVRLLSAYLPPHKLVERRKPLNIAHILKRHSFFFYWRNTRLQDEAIGCLFWITSLNELYRSIMYITAFRYKLDVIRYNRTYAYVTHHSHMYGTLLSSQNNTHFFLYRAMDMQDNGSTI
jgi:hypothetical protein